MRTLTLTTLLLLCGLSAPNYADRYNSMSDANAPPTTFDNDPATTANTYQPAVEPPPSSVTVPVQKPHMNYRPEDSPPIDNMPVDNAEPNTTLGDPDAPTNDLNATPMQPS